MASIQTQIRIDSEIKQEVSELLKSLGLDLSTAVNIFLRQCLINGGLPFAVKNKKLKKRILKAIEESERLLNDPNVKTYSSVNDLIKDLDENV